MKEKNLEEQTQMDKEQTAIKERNFFSMIILKKMSEREGVLTLPKSLEDAITKVMDFIEFEPIHRSRIGDENGSVVKEGLFFDECGEVQMGYSVGGIGQKHDMYAEDCVLTVIREFFITPKSEILVLDSTEKVYYSYDLEIVNRTMKRIISENQSLSNWEKEYLLGKLNREIKIRDSIVQIAEEVLTA